MGICLNFPGPQKWGSCLEFPKPLVWDSCLNFPEFKKVIVGQLIELPRTSSVGQLF